MIDPALEASRSLGEGLRALPKQRQRVAVQTLLAPHRPAPWRTGLRHTGYHVELSYLWRANVTALTAARSKAFRAALLEADPVGRTVPTWHAGQVRSAESRAEFPDVDPGPAARPST
jgi:hypothetical protein